MVDYSTVTEVTGYKVTSDQIQRMYTRYRFASQFCHNKEILEVACGSGQGLGYLEKFAERVVGCDYDEKLVQIAKNYYKNRVEVKHLDAHCLTFHDNSFDIVILYEAIYYLERPDKFIDEARRVLRDDGILIVCTVNRDWEDFNPSPYSHKYFSAPELYGLLDRGGFTDVTLYGDSKINKNTRKDKIISFIKQLAVNFHLMPKTMKGKEFLKRIFVGKLTPLPPEIFEKIAKFIQPVRIDHAIPCTNYKVLFALGHAKQYQGMNRED